MTDQEQDLEAVALRIAGVLGADGALAGAMAVAAYGFVRATEDVDFVVRVPLTAIQKRLRGEGIPTTLHRSDSLEGDFTCLKGTLGGVRFDLIPPLVAIDWEHSLEVVMDGGGVLRVVDLDGLIRLKLRAHGPKDLMDVAALLLLNPGHAEAARQHAASYGVLADLERWLTDPRLKTDIQGSAESRPRKKRQDVADYPTARLSRSPYPRPS